MIVPRRLLILYGSQEGCAESVAQRIAGDATGRYGWDVELLPCNSFKKTKAGTLSEERIIVVVTSTTGNGDPPDNCDRFWRYIKRRSHSKTLLHQLHFAVLGLGDTNYDKFCHIAKGVDRRLGELGGQRCFELGCADDGVGLAIVIEPWIANFFPALECTYKSLVAAAKQDKLTNSSTLQEGTTTTDSASINDSTILLPSTVARTTAASSSHSPAIAKPGAPSSSSSSSFPPGQSNLPTASTAVVSNDGNVGNGVESAASVAACNHNDTITSYVLPLPSKLEPQENIAANEARLVVLYGRKGTTTDKEIAEGLSAAASKKYGWTTAVLPCSKYRRTGVQGGFMSEKVVLLVMPILDSAMSEQLDDGCERFLRFLNRSSHKSDVLNGMKYAVVSVCSGDSATEDGEDYGADVDARLHELSANRYSEHISIDVGVTKSDAPERTNWSESYWSKYDSIITSATTPETKSSSSSLKHSRKRLHSLSETQIKKDDLVITTQVNMQQPRLPGRLRGITSDFGVFGTADDYEGIVHRANVAPLPRVLAAGFSCVFPTPNEITQQNGALRGGNQSYSEVSSGQDSPQHGNVHHGRNNQYSLRKPFEAQIVGAKYLTSGGTTSSRRVIHLDLNLLPDRTSKEYNPFKAKRMIQYIPGDAIGIVVPNEESVVNWLLWRLNLSQHSDDMFRFEANSPTPARDIAMGKLPHRRSKEAASIPRKYRTPRLTLTHVLDLSSPPKRGMLRALADFCIGDSAEARLEKSKLLLLSSRDGKEEFEKLILKMNAGLPEILHMFPTCFPPLSLLVRGLKTLTPRYYSVSSSPLHDPTKLSITLTVVEYNTKPPPPHHAESGSKTSHGTPRPVPRQGLCTTWLEQVAMPLLMNSEKQKGSEEIIGRSKRGNSTGSRSSGGLLSNSESEKETDVVVGEMKSPCTLTSPLSSPASSPSAASTLTSTSSTSSTRLPTLNPSVKIPIYVRETKEFALPANHKYPIIMVGPGTGVAPFIGFLEHRQKQAVQHSDHKDDVCTGYWRMGFELEDLEDDEEYSGQKMNSVYGECVLFFGNRSRKKDFLYEKKLNQFLKDGTLTQLHVAFSRDGPKKVYVQDRMMEQSKAVYRLLVKQKGYLYVCGDGAKMAKDVEKTLVEILSLHGKMSPKEAKDMLGHLKKQRRYVKDVWS